MFDFVSKRKWFFLVSAAVIILGIISLIVSGLNLGIDFKPGITMTLIFEEPVERDNLKAALGDIGYPDAVPRHSPKDAFILEGLASDKKDALLDELQPKFDTTIWIADFKSQNEETLALVFGEKVSEENLRNELLNLGYTDVTFESTILDSFIVRVGEPEQQELEEMVAELSERDRIRGALENEFSPLYFLDFDTISEEVALERVQYTTYAVIAAAVGILLYITWAFRRLARPISYGVCAIVALVHDALVVVGIFSLLRVEVNSMFIIAILTVIGYSVNNTIVVFDRIRENRSRGIGADFQSTVNISLTGTLGRSLNTSLTTLFVLIALFLFGGVTISNFVLALIIGIVVGTYSSLFIASTLLVAWERGELGRLFRWIPLRR